MAAAPARALTLLHWVRQVLRRKRRVNKGGRGEGDGSELLAEAAAGKSPERATSPQSENAYMYLQGQRNEGKGFVGFYERAMSRTAIIRGRAGGSGMKGRGRAGGSGMKGRGRAGEKQE